MLHKCHCLSSKLWWLSYDLAENVPLSLVLSGMYITDTAVLTDIHQLQLSSVVVFWPGWRDKVLYFYSTPVVVQNIVTNPSVCLSVCEHISGTTRSIFTKFCMQIPRGRGSILLCWCCDTLCTSGFIDDITFGCSGSYGDAWKARHLTYYH